MKRLVTSVTVCLAVAMVIVGCGRSNTPSSQSNGTEPSRVEASGGGSTNEKEAAAAVVQRFVDKLNREKRDVIGAEQCLSPNGKAITFNVLGTQHTFVDAMTEIVKGQEKAYPANKPAVFHYNDTTIDGETARVPFDFTIENKYQTGWEVAKMCLILGKIDGEWKIDRLEAAS